MGSSMLFSARYFSGGIILPPWTGPVTRTYTACIRIPLINKSCGYAFCHTFVYFFFTVVCKGITYYSGYFQVRNKNFTGFALIDFLSLGLSNLNIIKSTKLSCPLNRHPHNYEKSALAWVRSMAT